MPIDQNTAPADEHQDRSSRLTVGVLGLGLIGGSFAKAYASAGHRVLAFDTDAETMAAASVETVSGVLDDSTLASCDLIILAAYPGACLAWIEAHAERLAEASAAAAGNRAKDAAPAGPLVIDAAGVKRAICARAFDLAAAFGFSFVGAHPMAGSEHAGFAHARADLFHGAPMVLVPPPVDDIERLLLLDRAHRLLAPVGFGTYSVTTPEAHDRIIAFTSQLAHVVSNAYVKSPTAQEHHGFSAGSYRDLTRVAHLHPAMWAELMSDNATFLISELDQIIGALGQYRDALAAADTERLRALLAEGDRIKRALDDSKED